MSDNPQDRKSILELEVETATGAAQGACNLTWLRVSAFAHSVDDLQDRYKMGKAIFDSTQEEWMSHLNELRHGLELVFQEFNRAQYFKNVADNAQKKIDELDKEKLDAIKEDSAEDSEDEFA